VRVRDFPVTEVEKFAVFDAVGLVDEPARVAGE